jgi:hypothetical protein
MEATLQKFPLAQSGKQSWRRRLLKHRQDRRIEICLFKMKIEEAKMTSASTSMVVCKLLMNGDDIKRCNYDGNTLP